MKGVILWRLAKKAKSSWERQETQKVILMGDENYAESKHGFYEKIEF